MGVLMPETEDGTQGLPQKPPPVSLQWGAALHAGATRALPGGCGALQAGRSRTQRVATRGSQTHSHCVAWWIVSSGQTYPVTG